MFSETTGWHCYVSTHPVDGAEPQALCIQVVHSSLCAYLQTEQLSTSSSCKTDVCDALQTSCGSSWRLCWCIEAVTRWLSLAVSCAVVKCLATCRLRFVNSVYVGLPVGSGAQCTLDSIFYFVTTYIVCLFVSNTSLLIPFSSLFLIYLFPYLSFPVRTDPLHFQAGCCKRQLNLALGFVFILCFHDDSICEMCCSMLCTSCLQLITANCFQ